jgi:hypothetical protein
MSIHWHQVPWGRGRYVIGMERLREFIQQREQTAGMRRPRELLFDGQYPGAGIGVENNRLSCIWPTMRGHQITSLRRICCRFRNDRTSLRA